MITFNTLNKIPNNVLLDCFNQSFSDYSIPFKLRPDQLDTKLHTESINKAVSVGAFKGDALIGFVLHGDRLRNGKRIAYNAGTGVIPVERGNSLTLRMYDHIHPIILAEGFSGVVLEVLSDNGPAIASYTKVGFQKTRELHCFKGELQATHYANDIQVSREHNPNLDIFDGFGEIEPSWQNTKETIALFGTDIAIITAFSATTLCGFAILNPSNHRLLQIAVKTPLRNQGVGRSLLHYIATHFGTTTSVINVDSRFQKMTCFFEKHGLNHYLTQNEMQWTLGNQ